MKQIDTIKHHIKLYTDLYNYIIKSSIFFIKIDEKIAKKLYEESLAIQKKIDFLKDIQEL